MAFMNARGVDVRIARIFNTFGPRMREHDGRAVPQFVTQALAGEPITVYGDGSQTRSLCYVDDLVEGLMRLLRSDYRLPVNLGNPHEVTMLQLAEIVRDLCESDVGHRDASAPRRRSAATLPGRERRGARAGLAGSGVTRGRPAPDHRLVASPRTMMTGPSAPALRRARKVTGPRSTPAGIRRLLAAEDRHFWFRARNEIIAALAGHPIRTPRRRFSHSRGRLRERQRAAGPSAIWPRDAGRVEGLELSARGRRGRARQRTGLDRHRRLPCRPGRRSDASMSSPPSMSSSTSPTRPAVLEQMRDRLRPGGRLILTVPAHQSLWSAFDVASGHERRYTLATLSRALRASGFRRRIRHVLHEPARSPRCGCVAGS